MNISLSSEKTPFSPRSRQHISNRLIASPSVRRSLKLNVSGRSVQSLNQTIIKSQNNYIERFGQPLPVLITEGLTFSERNTVVTAKISNCGYAWLVCGRRLLVWQYCLNSSQIASHKKNAISGQCFELQLPHSDLAHRAELVSVYNPPGVHFPSCIAVSPEGIVRYWPAVNYESISIEQTVDLQGQECDSLTNIDGFGYILATTTCTVVLIQPQYVGGRHNLNCRSLKTPSGWLGGLSKKMSSLIFGSISSEQSIETRLVRVLNVPIDESSWYIYVLAGHSLQKWKLSVNGQEQLIFMVELNRLVSDGFLATVFENCAGDQSDLDTWLLDIQSDKDNIILLAAAVNMHVSSQAHYAMICIQTNTNLPPTSFQDFLLLQITGLYRDDDPSECLSYRFLLSGNTAYVYNQRSITVIKPQEDPDVLDFDSPHDFLLGGSICDNLAIFFSRNHGLICVHGNDDTGGPDLNISTVISASALEASTNETGPNNLSLYSLDPEEIMSAFKDTLGQAKAAFIFHVQNQQSSSRDIIEQLFPSESTFIPGIDSVMDKIIVQICHDILNDVPASDPRWSNTNEIGIGSSYSVQILRQLEDKQKALSLFFKFLKESQLWNRLSAVTQYENTLCTVHILADFSEKVLAAITLKNISNDEILDECIEKTVSGHLEPENGLTYQDLFYREVTKVEAALQQISSYSEEIANSAQKPTEIAERLRKCNEIILHILKTVIQYRQVNAEKFVPRDHARKLAPDYLPWTIVNNPSGLYGSLYQQQSITYNYGVKYASDLSLLNTLYDQLVCLIDIILDGHKSHMESIKGTEKEELLHKQYQKDRFQLINQLVTDKQWENAALLAEKYLDFKILVIICESTDNQQRLDEYMDRFSNEGFSEFVFNWYMQENKQAKLINRCRTVTKTQRNQTLSKFLVDHPSLAWMKTVFDQHYDATADILNDLAGCEVESVRRRKTMLSLSKLAKLITPDGQEKDDYIDGINKKLELIDYQEDIPDYVLESFGYDATAPSVISPKNLIHLYTCPEYKDSTELEFKKALELLQYIDDDELRSNSKLKIWRRAILKDIWEERNVDSPLEILQNKMFFKLADLAIMLGDDPEVLLPPMDILIDDDELSSLQGNKNFLFLIKTAYEYMYSK